MGQHLLGDLLPAELLLDLLGSLPRFEAPGCCLRGELPQGLSQGQLVRIQCPSMSQAILVDGDLDLA